MGVATSTYYGLTRTREMSPDAKDWAVTDNNFELISLLLKAFEQHTHSATVALTRPAYYDPIAAPVITNQGVAGTAIYTYQVVARGTIHKSSDLGSTITGNATLTGSNFNRLTWSAVSGATGYDVLRIAGGVTQGRIASNIAGVTFDDTGIAAVTYTPVTMPALTELATGGSLTPGTTVGVRIAYVDSLGLETDATPEATITLGPAASRPLTPLLTSTQPAAGALAGGTYLYAVTKRKATGETTISDVLPVSIPYDQTYSVTIQFDAVSSYPGPEGVTSVNIYRANGLNSPFQLLTTVTGATATFIDTNVISPGNQNVRPPTTSTFDASRKVNINWSALGAYPSAAKRLRVYVTQQAGIWGNNSLLQDYDLLAAPPTSVDYLGTEPLSLLSPNNSSQIPAGSPKVDLSTQATGAPTLTANMNFAGFQGLNLRLHNNSGAPASPTNGFIYYDTSINNVRAFINGAWVVWGTTTASAYSHPAEEAGGHLAANIKYLTGGVTVKSILDRFVNTGTGAAKVISSYTRSTATTNSPTTSVTAQSSSNFVPEMSITSPPTTLTNQEIEITFTGSFQGSTALGAHFCLEVNGVTRCFRHFSSLVGSDTSTITLHDIVTVTGAAGTTVPVKVLWWITGGTLTALSLDRQLIVKLMI